MAAMAKAFSSHTYTTRSDNPAVRACSTAQRNAATAAELMSKPTAIMGLVGSGLVEFSWVFISAPVR
jgi:hypothetical protein